jgi:hypothetical protein
MGWSVRSISRTWYHDALVYMRTKPLHNMIDRVINHMRAVTTSLVHIQTRNQSETMSLKDNPQYININTFCQAMWLSVASFYQVKDIVITAYRFNLVNYIATKTGYMVNWRSNSGKGQLSRAREVRFRYC